ncbi:MAG: type II toxin-antitoxin system VapC family toxin [Deltaproteobacteria bacterium]|nr:type II toxin-antitoxin system VapC family toxin [Deltaproteobacteria bacterium]
MALKWFLPETSSQHASHLLARFRRGMDDLLAPALLLAEFAYNLCKRCQSRQLTSEEVREIWGDFLALGIETVAIRELSNGAVQIALDHMANYYDAVYITLAQARQCTVITADAAMSRAFQALTCVTLLGSLAT